MQTEKNLNKQAQILESAYSKTVIETEALFHNSQNSLKITGSDFSFKLI